VNLSGRVQYGGLVVALSSFGVTRLFVVEALQVDAPLPFLVAGLFPLVVGLVLTVYGVTLALGPFTSRYVNTVTRWHLLGVGAMLVVFGVTALEGVLRGDGFRLGNGAPLLVANVLLGGAIGGTLTGIRSGKTIQQRREIRRSANQALLVNRLLKHEVLNAANIVDGYAKMIGDGGEQGDSVVAIREAAGRIKSTVDEVGTMADPGDRSRRVDAATVVREAVAALDPVTTSIDVSIDAETTTVAADDRLSIVVRELLENAVEHATGSVTVTLREAAHSLELVVADDGAGLPEPQRALLTDGTFPEFDDPTAGFGLQMVRLLVVQFGGEIDVEAGTAGAGDGTRVTVRLPRTGGRVVSARSVGLTMPAVSRAILGGVLGGVAMGMFYAATTGLLPVIGSLYGLESPVVGWVTHLFHSAVFGLLFAAVCALTPVERFASGALRATVLGLAWGVVLWVVGAGLLMPAWLSVVGVGVGTPRFSLFGLAGHALWGVVVGVVYWASGELAVGERLRRVPRWAKGFTR
jgi:two-component system OmpR family sensor kinase